MSNSPRLINKVIKQAKDLQAEKLINRHMLEWFIGLGNFMSYCMPNGSHKLHPIIKISIAYLPYSNRKLLLPNRKSKGSSRSMDYSRKFSTSANIKSSTRIFTGNGQFQNQMGNLNNPSSRHLIESGKVVPKRTTITQKPKGTSSSIESSREYPKRSNKFTHLNPEQQSNNSVNITKIGFKPFGNQTKNYCSNPTSSNKDKLLFWNPSHPRNKECSSRFSVKAFSSPSIRGTTFKKNFQKPNRFYIIEPRSRLICNKVQQQNRKIPFINFGQSTRFCMPFLPQAWFTRHYLNGT